MPLPNMDDEMLATALQHDERRTFYCVSCERRVFDIPDAWDGDGWICRPCLHDMPNTFIHFDDLH